MRAPGDQPARPCGARRAHRAPRLTQAFRKRKRRRAPPRSAPSYIHRRRRRKRMGPIEKKSALRGGSKKTRALPANAGGFNLLGMSTLLLIGTKKGLFFLTSEDGRKTWKLSEPKL